MQSRKSFLLLRQVHQRLNTEKHPKRFDGTFPHFGSGGPNQELRCCASRLGTVRKISNCAKRAPKREKTESSNWHICDSRVGAVSAQFEIFVTRPVSLTAKHSSGVPLKLCHQSPLFAGPPYRRPLFWRNSSSARNTLGLAPTPTLGLPSLHPS
jgi:hypothetical protein